MEGRTDSQSFPGPAHNSATGSQLGRVWSLDSLCGIITVGNETR